MVSRVLVVDLVHPWDVTATLLRRYRGSVESDLDGVHFAAW